MVEIRRKAPRTRPRRQGRRPEGSRPVIAPHPTKAFRVPIQGGVLDLSGRPLLMGILNVTPDSFSDGGLYRSVEEAVARGLEMETEGAEIIDVGGESTRPGSMPVPADEEMRRVIPVIRELAAKTKAVISVDTTKATVAVAAVAAGARVVNDTSALSDDPEMAAAVQGAHVVRVHDVKEMREVVEVAYAIRGEASW